MTSLIKFQELQSGDQFLSYASDKCYPSMKRWVAVAEGETPVKINDTLWKVKGTNGRNIYSQPSEIVEVK